MNRCVIIGGADINNYSAVSCYIRDNDYIIYCDCGLKHMKDLGVKANLIVGDFDSHEKPKTDIETITLPCEKDDTDTVYAIREALRRGYSDFLLAGVIGNRLDHTLVNIYALRLIEENGGHGVIVDDYSEMELVPRGGAFVPDVFEYFSLIAISGDACGVTIKDAKYTLEGATITSAYQYASSNEPIRGKSAHITVSDGTLLLIRDRATD